MIERIRHSSESQIAYWNHEGATKTFTHPINTDWLQKHLKPDARILDYGCGYGRVAAMLSQQGYQVIGMDSARRDDREGPWSLPAVVVSADRAAQRAV